MELSAIVRIGIISCILLSAVGMGLQVVGGQNDALILVFLYGALTLAAGVALVAGYGLGRRPQPEEHDSAARRKTVRHAALWIVPTLLIMIAAPVVFDGQSIGEAVAGLTRMFTRAVALPLGVGVVGYIMGRLMRNDRAPTNA